MFIRNLTISVFGLALMLLSATDGSAATFNQTHPRRAEVNHRLAAENARIRHGVKEGTITPKEAAQLHSEVHGVRVEERTDAAEHNGHITKAEQHQLNQDENAVSRDIYNAAH